ncbi:protein EFR3 homolog B-like isoform X1 [Lytechinus variegatus]|uniref:protein EFR3 homolog B-like isoform X1 n=1 Tax=Lytechinus variegatus TaxID=7654 RepID=UPI001BB0E487|nr:protein EFR3 homolog B-like isoform X1 [Lytechinus variegatus]
MPGCCNCFAACKPRYKRLVDNIYPDTAEEGLVRSNMEKLTFYAVSHNEKLDRIGSYLAQRLDRDVYRQRIGYVLISMQALDQLLLACHAQSLNLFVESFLKMVHKLLESNNIELQVYGTQSFVKFANIEEDTPSYHRRYDFFISKFSSMCHNNNENMSVRRKIRIAGLKGIQGVIRKTVSDELQVKIWEKQHMEKIVPSLLFNMHEGFERYKELACQQTTNDPSHESPVSDNVEERPAALAETCLRNVMCSAAYNNIHSVLKPVLRHLDLHEIWLPTDFAVKVFKVIMYSMQSQYLYVAPHYLLLHLDENMNNSPRIKRSIVEVLKETVAIAADGAVGTSVLEVFNTLLRHLRSSVDKRLSGHTPSPKPNRQAKQDVDERQEALFEEAIIDTIGAFASILPDYQKIEIMMFIMGKIPLPRPTGSQEHLGRDSAIYSKGEGDILLQSILLKSLLEVGTKYVTVSMASTFPASFMQPLLNMSVVQDPDIRYTVQEILQTLIDRHDNTNKLRRNIAIPRNISELNLRVEKPSRQDISFLRKNGADIQWHIYENLRCSANKSENYVGIFTTLALLCVEFGTDDILVDLVKVSLALQDMVCDNDCKLGPIHRCAVHALVARYLNLISQLTAIPALGQHVWSVIDTRQKTAPYLLPPFNVENNQRKLPSQPLPASVLFQKDAISDGLRSSGHDISRLNTPFIHEPSVEYRPRSGADVGSVNIELESAQSSPTGIRKHPQELVTFESLKKVLTPMTVIDGGTVEEEREKRLAILNMFQNSSLDQLAASAEQRSEKWYKKLNDILDTVVKTPVSPAGSPVKADPSTPAVFHSVPTYDMKFPELCVY